MTKALKVLGTTLLLGGLGHSVGVSYLYFTSGFPETDRIMLDLWIAEAQLLAGALYLVASRSKRKGVGWRALAAFGAAATIGFAVPILPILYSRAPLAFTTAPIVYLVASVCIVVGLVWL